MRPSADTIPRPSSDAPPVRALDASLSVNETLRRWPATIAVLNALGVDTCCGGAASLDEAAADVGVPTAELLDRLARAIGEGA